jgi:hypothetical protein
MIINKFLKFIGLKWVIRQQRDLSEGLQAINYRKSYLLIFGHLSKYEKVLLGRDYSGKWFLGV